MCYKMATPIKSFHRVVIPNADVCVCCSTKNIQKYLIVKKVSATAYIRGPAFDLVSDFYEKNIDIGAGNDRTFVCIVCYRMLNRIKDTRERLKSMIQNISKTSQIFKTCSSVTKRAIISTPPRPSQETGASASRGMDISTPSTSSTSRSNTVVTPTAIKLSGKRSRKTSSKALFSDSEQPSDRIESFQLAQPLSVTSTPQSTLEKQKRPLEPHMTPSKPTAAATNSSGKRPRILEMHKRAVTSPAKKNNLKKTVVFRSVDLSQIAFPIIKSIANGSIAKAVRTLLTTDRLNISRDAKNGICQITNKEIKSLTKNKDSEIKNGAIETFDVKKLLMEFQTKLPTMWHIMSSAGTSTYTKLFKEAKVCTALCTLLQSRSQCLNGFQKIVSIAMYNHHLQKEGFAILSKLGISVTNKTLNNILNKAKDSNDKKMAIYMDQIAQHKATSKEDHETTSYLIEDEHSYAQTCNTMSPIKPASPPAFVLVMDNIDFYIKVREMTKDHQNQSKHYVQMMAVVDRVLCEDIPNDHAIGPLSNVENCEFFPSAEDNYTLRKDMIHVVSNILVENLEAFNIFNGIYPDYFEHEYSTEMSSKSTMPTYYIVVLPLGIIMKNENQANEMIEIMEFLHRYVPGSRGVTDQEKVTLRQEEFVDIRTIPVGGDQLTCERMRSAHLARMDADTPEERLEGVMAMAEDFHEKMNFLQALMDRFYKVSSACEVGTLYQLKTAIARKNVVKDVTSDYHAVSSFVDLVTDSHVIAAALVYLNMSDMKSQCSQIQLFSEFADDESKKRELDKIVCGLVDKFFLNSLSDSVNKLEAGGIAGSAEDGVYNYAVNLTKYGLIRKISVMATRSGDGLRQMRHWRYAFLVYHLAHKYKYRLESFLLTAGIKALYTPRQRQQIIWNRFVNLTGGANKNLDGDYVLELLNGYAKGRIKILGPNHSPDIVDRIGKTMFFCNHTTRQLENAIGVAPESRYHTKADKSKDKQRLIDELIKADVFSIIKGRKHSSFNEQYDMFSGINVQSLHKYIIEKKKEYSKRKYAF